MAAEQDNPKAETEPNVETDTSRGGPVTPRNEATSRGSESTGESTSKTSETKGRSKRTAPKTVTIRNRTRRVVTVQDPDGYGIHIQPKDQVTVPKNRVSADVRRAEAVGLVRIR